MVRIPDERGFITYDAFQDVNGIKLRVHESSSAEESRVWLFADAAGFSMGIELNEETVDKLVAALNNWKEDPDKT